MSVKWGSVSSVEDVKLDWLMFNGPRRYLTSLQLKGLSYLELGTFENNVVHSARCFGGHESQMIDTT